MTKLKRARHQMNSAQTTAEIFPIEVLAELRESRRLAKIKELRDSGDKDGAALLVRDQRRFDNWFNTHPAFGAAYEASHPANKNARNLQYR